MSVIRGVLLAGKFRSQEELNGMSRDDQRNTLIVELVNHSNQPVGHFQGLDDAAVAGAGAVMVFLRETRARTDDELRRMSDDDQRNTAIVVLNAQTGIPGPQLQGMGNLELIALSLGDPAAPIRGVLLAGKFRSQEELNGMSRDDQRNTLIVELVNHSNQPVGHFQGLDDAAVAGAGAVMVFLRETRARTDDELRRMSDDDQRNIAIVALNTQTGIPGPRLQGMSNLELVHEVLGIDVDLSSQVFGAIGDKWRELGGLKSFLGPPTSDELSFDEGGKVRFFNGGAIYFWLDSGAMVLPNNKIAVRYSGFNCFGTSNGPGDDEPYFIFGVIAPSAEAPAQKTRIYENVAAGNNVSDSLELFRGAPVGIGIDVTLMEHDLGSPDKYRKIVDRVISDARPRISTALTLIPAVGQVLSVGALVAMELLHDDIVDAVNGLLGTDEDRLGQQLIHLTPKQMIVLATQTPINDLGGVRFKLQTGLFDGEGSSYKACFDIAPA